MRLLHCLVILWFCLYVAYLVACEIEKEKMTKCCHPGVSSVNLVHKQK